jgi:hypothetical protein
MFIKEKTQEGRWSRNGRNEGRGMDGTDERRREGRGHGHKTYHYFKNSFNKKYQNSNDLSKKYLNSKTEGKIRRPVQQERAHQEISVP